MEEKQIDYNIVFAENNIYPVKLNLLTGSGDFNTYLNEVKDEVNNQLTTMDDVYASITPFVYSPKYYVDNSTTNYISKDIKRKLLQNYIKINNISLKELFNNVMFNLPLLYINLMFPKDANNIKLSSSKSKSFIQALNTATMYTTIRGNAFTLISEKNNSGNNANTGAAGADGEVPYYLPIIKHKFGNKEYYIFGNDDGTLAIYEDITPLPSIHYNKRLTSDEMEDILVDLLIIKFHFLKIVEIEFSNGDKLVARTFPYFYPPFGLQANFNFNKSILDLNNRQLENAITITKVNLYYYFYSYLHLTGVYLYKSFIDLSNVGKKEYALDDFKLLEVPKEFLPFNTTYIGLDITNMSILDNSTPVEIELEKAYLRG